jgi:nucleotide-binding universal stress UspA family protein
MTRANNYWRSAGFLRRDRVKFRELLEGRLPLGRSAKIIDGRHPEDAPAQQGEEALKPDVLPISDEQNGHGHAKRNVLVAVSGCELDREVVSLAGKVAREKRAKIYAVYGIEVPRSKVIDDEMPAETESGQRALYCVGTVADKMGLDIDTEIVQSRHFGHSLVDEAQSHDCALLIYGVPFRHLGEDEIAGQDTLDYILRHAPCRVWIIRGQPPEQEIEHGQSERERTLIKQA